MSKTTMRRLDSGTPQNFWIGEQVLQLVQQAIDAVLGP